MENNLPEWGPSNSPEFGPIMAVIVVICGLACACAIFPIVETVVEILIAIALLTALGHLIAYVRWERRLDWEATYGPLTEEEKEHVNDEH